MNHRSSMINVSPVLEWDTNSIPTLKLISLQFENHVKKKNSCRESASTTSQTGGKSVANTLWLRAVNIVKALNLSMPDIFTQKNWCLKSTMFLDCRVKTAWWRRRVLFDKKYPPSFSVCLAFQTKIVVCWCYEMFAHVMVWQIRI